MVGLRIGAIVACKMAARCLVERWLLGRLRKRTFCSLAEVYAALAELMRQLNEEHPIRRLGVTRPQLLEEVDRPALKPLPAEPYEFREWKTCRVGVDYHVEIAAHSVGIRSDGTHADQTDHWMPRFMNAILTLIY